MAPPDKLLYYSPQGDFWIVEDDIACNAGAAFIMMK